MVDPTFSQNVSASATKLDVLIRKSVYLKNLLVQFIDQLLVVYGHPRMIEESDELLHNTDVWHTKLMYLGRN